MEEEGRPEMAPIRWLLAPAGWVEVEVILADDVVFKQCGASASARYGGGAASTMAASHPVHVEKESERGERVRGKIKENALFKKLNFKKIMILPLCSLTHNSHTVASIWVCRMSANSY